MEKLKGPNEPSGPELRMMAILDRMGLKGKYEYELRVRSGFVLDFAFIEKRIGLEVDGYPSHFTPKGKKRDAFRSYILRRGGWQIFRITADELNNEPKVVETVKAFLG